MAVRRSPVLQWRKVFLMAATILIPLLLTACGVIKADITLYGDEEWTADTELILTPQEVSMAGGEAALEAELQRKAAQLRQQNVRYNWRKQQKDGNSVYHFSIEGKGWAVLNNAVFSDQAEISSTNEGRIYFRYSPLFAARVFTLRLTGGEIVSSNADEVRGSTAIWYNVVSTGYAEATMTPAMRLISRPSLPCLGSLGLVTLVTLVAIATKAQSSRSMLSR